jgi:radical SAM protein with 4Fe4S-binding SPASM domain
VDCGVQMDLGSSEYVDLIARKAYRERVPVSGAVDLTYRCNFRCRHCYAAHLVAQPCSEAGELSKGEILTMLAAAAEKGCLFLLLSGGEPLLRDDFVDIYAAAAQMGFVITVYTNGSLIGPSHLEVFAEYPPHLVEVSLYGASEVTYQKVTRVANAYLRVRRRIEQLVDSGVRVGLKTMILKENVEDVPAMEAFAEEFGLRFRLDPLVTPRLDGDLTPLSQRVEPDRAVATELRSPERRAKTAEFLEGHGGSCMSKDTSSGRLYRCGAGAVGFHLDPQGIMRPCLMSRDLGYNVARLGFAEAWSSVVTATDQVTSDKVGECGNCPHILVCGYCPALFALEQGSPSEPAKYVCKLGETRYRTVARKRPEVEYAR